MNLGIVADEIDRNFENAVRIGSELGLRRFEIRHLLSGRAPMCNLEEMRDVERIAALEGVSIAALSPGLFKYTEDAPGFAREMDEVYPRAAEWALRWKLPGLIVFGFHRPGVTEENVTVAPREAVPDRVADWLSLAGERAAGDGLVLMVEPEPVCWADSARAAANLIERAGGRGLRINYDPGNVAWLEQRDPIDEFVVAKSWIANVHIKDLLPFTGPAMRPVFVPAGQGIVDYRAHFAALRRHGYQGPISLEPHMDGRLETIRKCKQAVERLWSEA